MFGFGRKTRLELKRLKGLERLASSVVARYDAAQHTAENQKHWAMADALSAEAANSPGVRRDLRNRSRYETQNNSYLCGLIRKIENDVLGTGPRLRFLTGDGEADRRASDLFAEWMDTAGMADKLGILVKAKIRDGESFQIATTNPKLRTPVKLDLKLIEAEQCASPGLFLPDQNKTDGIQFDAFGNPETYFFLKRHPGDFRSAVLAGVQADSVSADNVIHYFLCERAGQVRGIPDLMSALPLGAMLRRYTLSVLAASETASDFAAFLKTTGPAQEVDSAKDLPTIEIMRRMLVPLPEGYEPFQMKSEQPTNTYKEFKREVLSEQGACVSAPLNIIGNNSEGYNYSSGRLDFQAYQRMILCERKRLERNVLNRIVRMWLAEAMLIEDYLPPAIQVMRRLDAPIKWRWSFDGFFHVDPQKENTADDIALKNGSATLQYVLEADGRDWEEHMEQQKREYDMRERLGLPQPTDAPPIAPAQNTTETTGVNNEAP